MVKALVFDFDGLILDTETPEYRSWAWVFGEYGATLPQDVWALQIGTSATFDPYEYLERQVGAPIPVHEVRSRRRDWFSRAMEAETLRPGVEACLQAARLRGLRLAIASSSGYEWVHGYLTRFGLREYFDCVKTGDMVERVKPDPALYLAALECLGVAAGEAVAFEDSPNGSTAALRAGIRCVVVPHGMTQDLQFPAGVTRISSLADVSLDALLAEERS